MNLFETLKQKWNDSGLFILAMLSIAFILLLALSRIGKKGTYDKNRYDIIFTSVKTPAVQKSHPVRESTGELLCRDYLERKFNRKFDKIRPDFLKNPVTGGYNLELDCYCPSLRLAVEYSGAQHYKFIPHFHKNKEAFTNQKYRDEMKRVKCRENKIVLIEVPYTVSHDQIASYLEQKLKQFGYFD